MIYAAILLLIALPVLLIFGAACHLFGRLVGALWERFIPPPPRR